VACDTADVDRGIIPTMLHLEPPASHRELRCVRHDADFVVVGGGLAGTCCAITAARQGLKVVLVQDRPVLGGNASSEVRLWILGATAHMGNNCRWARESGVVGEFMVENMARNPEGNALLVDALLLEMCVREPNLTLLLNTAAIDCAKADADPDTIASVRAFCSQNSTMYDLHAPLFCDASGDGILGFRAGAAFRIGAEERGEFDEKFAPDESYGSLLGHSIYFYSKNLGRPVDFVAPSFALTPEEVVTKIPRHQGFKVGQEGCMLWWIEYGGRLDTIHDTETIKWELWKVAYGVWNYFKNSGKFPEARNLTLEWIGHVPGKRESRRFEGDYMITQHDFVEQRLHDDDVSFGGWAIDLHPADGVYSPLHGCTQWHTRGVYAIPYRCMYSRNIRNLFLAGRVVSASHVAFGSTRVMATCALGAQAVGVAAAVCRRRNAMPRDIASGDAVRQLQRELIRTGQHIPGVRLDDPDDLARHAAITATTTLRLDALAAAGDPAPVGKGVAQMLPVGPGPMPTVTLTLDADRDTTARIELRACNKPDHHTPERILATREVSLPKGLAQRVAVNFDVTIDQPRYVFVSVAENPNLRVHMSDALVTGLTTVWFRRLQKPDQDIGVETLDIWTARRRPLPQNLAVSIDPPLSNFGVDNLTNGLQRPTCGANAWIADPRDPAPAVTLQWTKPVTIGRVVLSFDADYDHPMESVLYGHPERHMPYCVRHFRLRDASGAILFEDAANHHDRREIVFDAAVTTDRLTVECVRVWGVAPAAMFEVRAYAH
jgi:hypothetical protein